MGKVRKREKCSRRQPVDVGSTIDISSRPSTLTTLKSRKKSDKLRDRHEAFMHKIRALQKTSLSSSQRRNAITKRKKRPPKRAKVANIMGNMRTLLDALPTLEPESSISKSRRDHRRRGRCGSGSAAAKIKKPLSKFNAAKKNMMKDIAVFRQVLKHPAYVADPAGAIAIHLRNTIEVID